MGICNIPPVVLAAHQQVSARGLPEGTTPKRETDPGNLRLRDLVKK